MGVEGGVIGMRKVAFWSFGCCGEKGRKGTKDKTIELQTAGIKKANGRGEREGFSACFYF